MRDRYLPGVRWTGTFHSVRKKDNAVAFPNQTAAGGCMVQHHGGVKRTPLPGWKIACRGVVQQPALEYREVSGRFAAAQHAGS
jgi:hypothetical protein